MVIRRGSEQGVLGFLLFGIVKGRGTWEDIHVTCWKLLK